MHSKAIFIVIFYLVKHVYPESTNIVSTTSNPVNSDLQSKVKENKERLEILEMQIQNLQTQKILEKLVKLHTDEKTENSTNFPNCSLQIESILEKNKKDIISEIEMMFDKKFEELQLKILKDVNNALPEDCAEILKHDPKISSGVYKIKPKLSPTSFEVRCDMETRGGGWTYLLNRFDGSQEFYLNWNEYRNGFGNLSREHWLGLDYMYQLTSSKITTLLIEMVDWEGQRRYAIYKEFSIGSENDDYLMKVLSGFSGDVTDDLVNHRGKKFITPDHKNNNENVVTYHGPWWYHDSFHVKLTGSYNIKSSGTYGTGIHWGSFHGYSYSLKEARMLIRPLQ